MNIRVGVFFGGTSVEHEISVISAIQAIHAMDLDKYTPVPIYISKGGVMYAGDSLIKIDKYIDIPKLLGECDSITLARHQNEVCIFRTPPKLFGNKLGIIDFALPIVHGTNCEDGTMQGLFELLRIPYAGCDVLSSAVGMEKSIMKDVLMQNNIPIVKHITFHYHEWNNNTEDIVKRAENDIGYPMIIKPSNLGSSVGISRAKDRFEFQAAVNLAGAFAPKIIVEAVVTNLKEINCSVIGDTDNAFASACEEPISSDKLLSYTDKYLNKSSGKGMNAAKRILPADLSLQKEEEIKELAIKTFRAIGCNGVSRIDFLLDLNDLDKVYVNEINTIPGSLSFYLWEATNKPFSKLLTEIISLGFKRERERKNLMYTYDSNIFAMNGNIGFKGNKNSKY